MNDILGLDGSIFNGGNFEGVNTELLKAVVAGNQSGADYLNVDNVGQGLKVEALDSVVKILTNTEKHIVFWKALNKQSVTNTVVEYNQQLDYGNESALFNLEGETPSFTDGTYRRKSNLIKFLGLAGEVTDAATLVRNADGMNNYARAVKNTTALMMRAINKALTSANSSIISSEFNGLFQQHFEDPDVGNGNLDTYSVASQVIDARGVRLTDNMVQDACHRATNDNFGYVDKIISNPVVFSEYAKGFQGDKTIMVNNPTGATTDAVMGQRVKMIATQFGDIDVMNDIFFDYKVAKNYNAAATHAKAPATPVVGAAPVAVRNAVATSKWAGFTGDYWYGVTAKNRYGESAMLVLDENATTVPLATDVIDLQFTAGVGGAYAAEGFVIYRTKKNETAYTNSKAFHPIFEITTTQLAAGYDSAAQTKVCDKNREIPNTHSAFVTVIDPEYFEYLQLRPISKMDLAVTSPALRYMVLNYGTPAMYQAKKVIRIKNLGDIAPA